MNILIFGGTTEGRQLCNFLKKNRINFTLSVATDYGKFLMDNDIQIIQQRLNSEQMKEYIKRDCYTLVIDATHPYATEVTQNIEKACYDTATDCIRIVRERSIAGEGVTSFETSEDIIRYLNSKEGNILLGTGSKDIELYKQLKNHHERIFVRILPMIESINSCLEVGIKNSNIICMQGPFTKEMDIACIRHTKARYMVTKNSGAAGGFAEKIAAAKETGIELLVISAKEEEGLSYEEAVQYLEGKFKQNCSPVVKHKKFPLFIELAAKTILVIGGGQVAERRIKKLLSSGVHIQLISPHITESLQRLSEVREIDFIKKEYEETDLKEDTFLVIAATDKNSVNESIYKHAKAKGILRNIADCKEKSDVWFPSVIEDSIVSVAISSVEGNPNISLEAAEKVRRVLEHETEN